MGQNRSHHPGDGGEFADIRPFRFGDRLRRVHWPVSVRTGELHVTATHADQDSEVLLLVDAMHDIGTSQGGAAAAWTCRTCGGATEHYLRSGDRGPARPGRPRLARRSSAAGKNHLRGS